MKITYNEQSYNYNINIAEILRISTGLYSGLPSELIEAMQYEPYKYPKKIPLMSANEISSNTSFPPSSQISRVEGYRRNELLYNNKLKEALPGISGKLTVMHKYSALKGLLVYLTNPTTENYCRTITDAKLNLLYASGIKISSNKDESNAEVEEIHNIITKERLIQKIVVDISRFGECVVVLGLDHKPKYIKPSNWFPVYDALNEEITCHIIVSEYITANTDGTIQEFMKVDYHYKGYYNRNIYKYSSGSIGELVKTENNIKTGLTDDFAVVVFNNSLESINLFGSDDYTLILSQIEDLVVTNCITSFCLHKFNFPSLQGPIQATSKQMDGSNGFEMSPFYGISDGRQEIKQIDINFDRDALSNHKKDLIRTIGMLSGMKGTLNDGKENGYAESGRAREMRYADDIATTTKIKTFIEIQLQELVAKQGSLIGKKVNIQDINIVWSPSIQMSEFDKAELSQMLLGNMQVKSRESVYQEVYGHSYDRSLEEFNEYLIEKKQESEM